MIDPDLLLQGYRLGVFPMAMNDSIEWFSPDPRAVLPLENFHVPHSLRRLARRKPFEITIDKAHSVEAWKETKLAGGLYGVAVGGAFFGESMFHRVTDASKIALVALVEYLRARKFVLLDTQWLTPHLQQFGGIQISRSHYLRLLRSAVDLPRRFL
jgi:leucyl/phenylalanyl-tRNA--protein transferase